MSTRAVTDDLSRAITELEHEAENYRDGDEYQPRGKTLLRVAKNGRTALAKAEERGFRRGVEEAAKVLDGDPRDTIAREAARWLITMQKRIRALAPKAGALP